MKTFCICLFGLIFSISLHAGRYEDLKKHFAKNRSEHMSTVAATYFGGEGIEEFVAVGELKNGMIFAVGNAWGPQWPANTPATLLGKGRHSGAQALTKDRKGREQLRYTEDSAGFVLIYSADLSKITAAWRMDWGVARFSDACLDPVSGRLWICGKAGPHFSSLRSLSPAASSVQEGFLMKMGSKIESIQAIPVEGTPIQLMPGKKGPPHVVVRGPARKKRKPALHYVPVFDQGKTGEVMTMTEPGKGGFLGRDPDDQHVYFGGDRNTHTGYQPWRQPFFYKLNPYKEKALILWEPNPKSCACGGNGNGLCSDTSATSFGVASNGDWYVTLWSDGGNSIAGKHPRDMSREWEGKSPMGISTWGVKGANSFSWILRMDPKTQDVKVGTQWAAFLPESFSGGGNRPNAAHIDRMGLLDDGSVVLRGRAATGLVPTPHTYWERPGTYSGKMGGQYVTVLMPDLSNARFSSYLPGYDQSTFTPISRRGLLVGGRTAAFRLIDEEQVAPPATQAVPQPNFGGGARDAHLILLR